MQDHHLTLKPMPETMVICKLASDAQIPDWALRATFVSITRTPDELSIVISKEYVPDSVKCERDWKALKTVGPLDFSMVGVFVSVCTPLAEAGISVFAISTYDADYFLVKEEQFEAAVDVLRQQFRLD